MKSKIIKIAIFLFSIYLIPQSQLFAQLPEEWPHKEILFSFKNTNVNVPYWSNFPLDSVDHTIKRAVIAIHGINQWSKVILERILTAAKEENVLDETIVICPVFLEKNDSEHYKLNNSYPFWTSRWKYGDLSQNDKNRISSYSIIDEMLKIIVEQHSNLESIVITGFSAGGQFANRYAAGGRGSQSISDKIDVRYMVHAPSSYLYFNDERITEENNFSVFTDTSCNFNRYHYGLAENLNDYMNNTGVDQIRKNYEKRTVLHMVGAQDTAKKYLDVSCRAMLQGKNRANRCEVYLNYLQHYFGMENTNNKSKALIEEYAHTSRIYLSEESRNFMFPDL